MLRKADVVLLLAAVFSVITLFVMMSGGNIASVTSWSNVSSPKDKGQLIAVIKRNDLIIDIINLTQINNRKIIEIPGQYPQSVALEHNRICFLDSTCPDKICEKSGWLSKAGDLAVCLPNKTIIKLQQKK